MPTKQKIMSQIDDADLVDGDMIYGGLSCERESRCKKGTGDVYRVYPTIFLPIDSIGRFLPRPFSDSSASTPKVPPIPSCPRALLNNAIVIGEMVYGKRSPRETRRATMAGNLQTHTACRPTGLACKPNPTQPSSKWEGGVLDQLSANN